MHDPLWPRLWHIRISHELVSPATPDVWLLSPEAFRALAMLVGMVAAEMVWTMTGPRDGSLIDDDARLSRALGFSQKAWAHIKPELEPFFDREAGRWRLNRPWIEIGDRGLRAAIPGDVQRLVAAREGRRCTYFGDTDGPFDMDHILPVARGGTNEPSNLTMACASCNRSKGGRTLREWIGR